MKKLEKLKLKDITDYNQIPETEQKMIKGGVNYNDSDFVYALIDWMGESDIHSFTISNGSYDPVVVYHGSIVDYYVGSESSQEVIYISEESDRSIEFSYNSSDYIGYAKPKNIYTNTYTITTNS